ncbi:MAG: fermentation-respiration switch protein FrsA (DUF1100 family) [Planctomycetota bacterium]
MNALRKLTHFLGIAVIGYIGLCALVYFGQAKLVYHPGPAPDRTPADEGIPYEDIGLTTTDGVRLHAWLLTREEPIGTLIFCHGNAGNIESRLHAAARFAAMGFEVLIFDYRGYGLSQGEPSETGTYLDGHAAYDFVLGRGTEPDRIAVYGESLGCAIAIELCRTREVARVVLESGFTSINDVGAQLYRFLPIRLLSRFGYDNEAKIAALEIPKLIAHSPGDEVIPFAHGRRLFEVAPEPKSFLETVGGHNDGGLWLRPDWTESLRAFLVAIQDS